MPDILIRDVPADVLEAIDIRARRLGLSRSEYLRRRLKQEMSAHEAKITAVDFQRAAERCQDLLDPAVMARAWS